jgi:hypothetical protein
MKPNLEPAAKKNSIENHISETVALTIADAMVEAHEIAQRASRRYPAAFRDDIQQEALLTVLSFFRRQEQEEEPIRQMNPEALTAIVRNAVRWAAIDLWRRERRLRDLDPTDWMVRPTAEEEEIPRRTGIMVPPTAEPKRRLRRAEITVPPTAEEELLRRADIMEKLRQLRESGVKRLVKVADMLASGEAPGSLSELARKVGTTPEAFYVATSRFRKERAQATRSRRAGTVRAAALGCA